MRQFITAKQIAFKTFMTFAALGLMSLCWMTAGGVSKALSQAASASAMRPTMNVGDEPGRVSTKEVIITDGPYRRQLVFFRSRQPRGTLVVHTSERFLYVVLGNNRALRYGIGFGREGFQWSGLVKITRKAEWPDWTPPP